MLGMWRGGTHQRCHRCEAPLRGFSATWGLDEETSSWSARGWQDSGHL